MNNREAAEVLEDAINEALPTSNSVLHEALDAICYALCIERGRRYPTPQSARVYPCPGCGTDMNIADTLCRSCDAEREEERQHAR